MLELDALTDLYYRGENATVAASAEARLATAADPDERWSCLCLLGLARTAQGAYPEAMEAYSACLDTAPSPKRRAQALNNLAVLFLHTSAWDLAVECLGRLLESRELCAARPPYYAHINMALAQLHLGEALQGERHVHRALRLETTDLVRHNPSGAVTLRNLAVMVGMQLDRTDLGRHAIAAHDIAALGPDSRCHVLVELTDACLDVAYGDRLAGAARMERLLECGDARMLPEILFSLVMAEKLLGRPTRALAFLRRWEKLLYPAGIARARKMGLIAWLEPGEILEDHRAELVPWLKLPAGIL